jgi:hypothetical protein
VRINISGGSNTLYYLLKDHLGSASVVTDASGTVVGEDRFYPCGENTRAAPSSFQAVLALSPSVKQNAEPFPVALSIQTLPP